MPNLGDKLARLFARTATGVKFDLNLIGSLVEQMGHPERACAFVHVAGTNGKGSVCAMLDSVFRAAGWRTGLYTSPHLVRFNERIRVNGAPISDEELADLFEWVEPLDRQAASAAGRPATFFELTTAMAFEHFQRKGVELVVLETGMGGRLDATNVVRPLVSVITRIDLEHCQHLGRSIEQIAGEKAGIVKPGRPVVCGLMPPEADEVVARVAAERRALLVRAAEAVSVRRVSMDRRGQKIKLTSATADYPSVILPLLGRFQIENAATALAAAECAAQEWGRPLDARAVKQGLETVCWPARCQVLGRDPLVLLDVAHNPCGARALAETLRELGEKRKWGLIFSLLADKDAAGYVRELDGLIARAWIVPMRVERAAGADSLMAAVKSRGWDAEVSELTGACSAATAWARQSGNPVCIAGSLYLAGELLAAMEKGEIEFGG